MAYITTYTLHQLAKSFSVVNNDLSKDEFVEHIFNNPRVYSYLNSLERSYLFNFTELLKNPVKYFEQVPNSRDTGTFVRERDAKLIYHLYKECELLNKDFLGFKIPPEVRERKLITEFRKWFEVNELIDKYLNSKIDIATILYKYNSSFAPKYQLPILKEDYKLIEEKDNSGYTSQDESFDIQSFYREISDWLYRADNRLPISQWRLLGKWHSYGNKSIGEIEMLLEKLDINMQFRAYNTVEVIKEVMVEHHIQVNKLIKILREYFCWTYTLQAKAFDIVTLEDFNLKCCSNCRKIEMLIERDKSNVDTSRR